MVETQVFAENLFPREAGIEPPALLKDAKTAKHGKRTVFGGGPFTFFASFALLAVEISLFHLR